MNITDIEHFKKKNCNNAKTGLEFCQNKGVFSNTERKF